MILVLHRPDLSGEALSLKVWTLSGSLVNASGDAFTETPANSGRFEANVAEPLLDMEYRCDIEIDSEVEVFGPLFPMVSNVIGYSPLPPAALAGPYVLTIAVTDMSNQAIEGAFVRVYRAGETETKTTNSGGIVSYTVVPATWGVSVKANGYAGKTVIVAVSGDMSTTIELEPLPVTPPPSADATVVTVQLVSGSLESVAGAKVRVRPKRIAVVGEAISLSTVPGEGVTDASGRCDVIVPRLSSIDNTSTIWIVDAQLGGRFILDPTEFELTNDATTYLAILLT
jgi:hypothetical protein